MRTLSLSLFYFFTLRSFNSTSSRDLLINRTIHIVVLSQKHYFHRIFELLFLSTTLCLATSSPINSTSPIDSCSCWPGYEPKERKNGEYALCQGVWLLHNMPCNVPLPPNCVCGSEVTGILTDKTGVWCSRYERGQEVMRWPCENRDEWEEFYRAHPERRYKNAKEVVEDRF